MSSCPPILCALLALVALTACDAEPPDITGRVSEEPFHSAIVADDYVLRLRLPPGYDAEPERRYPLVVQLDPTAFGLQEFATTAGLISQYAETNRWPEAIVLGVDYADPFTRERDYQLPEVLTRDYAGDGADRFFRVLRDEILPHVEGTLRIDPAHRILMGHSKGGGFAWYAALRHAPPEPPLFSGIVAADCGYEEPLFTYERWHAERSDALPVRLYASRAVYNGAVQQIAFRAMLDRVAPYRDLQLASEELETDHAGAVFPSFEDGLDHVLGGGQ